VKVWTLVIVGGRPKLVFIVLAKIAVTQAELH